MFIQLDDVLCYAVMCTFQVLPYPQDLDNKS